MVVTLLYLLLLILPFNLGYHFILNTSYINGLLVDYLIPTVYLQDICVFMLVISWVIFGGTLRRSFSEAWLPRILLFLVFSLFLSTLVSINFPISVAMLLRICFYVFISIIVGFSVRIPYHWPVFLKLLLLSTSFIALLSTLQFIFQGSLFDNYLFFGEQPYNFSTYGISRESFFGKTIVPPYGTFRHPNVLAGYLSVVILWLVSGRHLLSQKLAKASVFTVALSILVIFFTTSLTALVSLLVGAILTYSLSRLPPKYHSKVLLGIVLLFFLSASALPYLNQLVPDNPSIYRRIGLYQVVNDNLDEYFWFGTGLGASTEISADHFKYFDAIKYPQPVHNIFVLMFIEGGLFAFIFYLFLYVRVLCTRKRAVIPFQISFIQFIILGLFDHYLLTMHQPFLLFWLTLGFYFAYNYNS